VWVGGERSGLIQKIRAWHGGKIVLVWAFGFVWFPLSREEEIWLVVMLLWVAAAFGVSWIWFGAREKS
jgi:hypothetical protein